jgi:hypothetical protein
MSRDWLEKIGIPSKDKAITSPTRKNGDMLCIRTTAGSYSSQSLQLPVRNNVCDCSLLLLLTFSYTTNNSACDDIFRHM